jgi:formylglycine-generating enzyme required for sulfatase activity
MALLLQSLLAGAAAFCDEGKIGGEPQKQFVNSIGMKLTLIPAGEFLMGSGETVEDLVTFFRNNYIEDLKATDLGFEDEHPRHRVRITRPFYMGTFHVTVGQFRRFVDQTHYKADAEKGDRRGAWGWSDNEPRRDAFVEGRSWRNVGFPQTDDHPVVCVSWNDAVAFCNWLSHKEGHAYRLPTEAEWEYSCRAGTTTRYYSGNDPETLAKVANIADAAFKAKGLPELFAGTIRANDGYVFTAPVGRFTPNAFGLYDMHGNADQWCADWDDSFYYARSPRDDPTGPAHGHLRVLRGGSWRDGPLVTRSASRDGGAQDGSGFEQGFRVARDK